MAKSPTPESLEDTNPLAAALRRCVVRLEEHGTVLGTGFFIASGEVLTCAHVVHGHDEVTAVWAGATYVVIERLAVPPLAVGDPAASFYPLPDVALLRLAVPPEDHPCVGLDLAEPASGRAPDLLRLDGFTVGEHSPAAVVMTGATVEYEGPLDEHGSRLFKLKGGQVLGGFSGAPLLNTRTGAVCAVVESSRGQHGALGGFAVPLGDFLDRFPGLPERNDAHHGGDPAWSRAAAKQRQVDTERAGRADAIAVGEHGALTLTLEVLGVLLGRCTRRQKIRQRPRPPEGRYRPEPFADHVDRGAETAELIQRVDVGQPVNLYGDPGIGKTYVLHLLAKEAPARFPDGLVYLLARGKPLGDLLQALFEELYECDPPFKPSDAKIRRDLATKQALVLVDAVELGSEDAQELVLAAPRCRFVLASRPRTLWTGAVLRLGGLEPAPAFALIETELGRPLDPEESADAERLCEILHGSPLAIRRAVSGAVDANVLLAALVESLNTTAVTEHLGNVVLSLPGDQQQVLSALAALGPASIGTAHLAALTDIPDVEASLAALERLHLVQRSSPRFRLVEPATGTWAEDRRLDQASRRASEYFIKWADGNRGDFALLSQESEALLGLLRDAMQRERFVDVIRLGRAMEGAFVWTRRWGAWGEIIDLVLRAALAADDEEGEAWALHQRGTLAFCLGQKVPAERDLSDALRLREAAGDAEGVEATRHNLRVISPPPPPWPALAGVLVVLATLGGVMWWWLGSGSDQVALKVDLVGTGTVISDHPGIDCGETCETGFAEGTSLTLTATAQKGFVFAGWRGGDCTGTERCSLVMRERTAIVASFEPAAVTRSLSVATTAGGRVVSEPSGIDCGRRCEASFADGIGITLTPDARKGSVFAGWRGACSGRAPCSIVMGRDLSVSAVFDPVVRHDLTVVKQGQGRGVVISLPGDIDCGGDCTASFEAGVKVEVMAMPEPGSLFIGWRGGCTESPCLVILNADQSVTAVFAVSRDLSVTNSDRTLGSVGSEPDGITCGSTCSATFPSGQEVTLNAVPRKGSIFVGWKGECSGTGPCMVLMDSDTEVSAVFRLVTYTLTVIVEGIAGDRITSAPAGIDCGPTTSKSTTVTCRRRFPAGTSVVLTATPSDKRYVLWDTDVPWDIDDCSSGTGTCSGALGGDTRVKANFDFDVD